jgi:hypothetical protein
MLLTVVAAIVYLVDPIAFRARTGIGVLEVVFAYGIGGFLGGGIAGLLIGGSSSRVRAFTGGFFALFPLVVTALLLRLGMREFWPLGLVSALVTSALIGGGLGVVMRDEHARR